MSLHDTQPIPTGTPPAVAVDHFTLRELRRLQSDVEQAIEAQREAGKREALATIKRVASEAELTADEVLAHLTPKPRRKRPRRGSKLPPKYRDPHNPQNTWAGRGKRPKWLQARLDTGAKIEDFAIPTTTVVETEVSAP